MQAIFVRLLLRRRSRRCSNGDQLGLPQRGQRSDAATRKLGSAWRLNRGELCFFAVLHALIPRIDRGFSLSRRATPSGLRLIPLRGFRVASLANCGPDRVAVRLGGGCGMVGARTRHAAISQAGCEAGFAHGLNESWRGWTPMVMAPVVFVALAPATWPRWAVMWGLALAIYGGAKWLTWRRTVTPRVGVVRSLGYLLAWPGLDAVAFLESHCGRERARFVAPSRGEWLFAWSKLTLGATIFFGFACLTPVDELPYLTGWIGMVGLVLMLHFGLFHILSCAWRRAGIEAAPLMDWPIAAVSVSEFWGRRWNRAFRDLAHRFLFRPLTPRLGAA